jgi:hypothetical protein
MLLFLYIVIFEPLPNHTIHDSREGGGGGVLSLFPPHLKKSLAYIPPPPKIFFGQNMSFFGNFLTNPRDFHKSAVKFHEILLPPPPTKIFLRPLPPTPNIFGRDHVCSQYINYQKLLDFSAYFYLEMNFIHTNNNFIYLVHMAFCLTKINCPPSNKLTS